MTTLWEATATTNNRAGSQQRVQIDVTRYVNKVDDSGWVRVKDQANADQVLCEFTKVTLIGSKDGRTFFKVMDGTNKGKTCSLKDANATIYLGSQAPSQSVVVVQVTYEKKEWWRSEIRRQDLEQQLASVSVAGSRALAALNSIWGPPDSYTPIPKGKYKIRIPDYPHDGNMTRFYRDSEPSLKFDQVWFPIEFEDNSRYLHVGHLSHGCVSILDLSRWVDIYRSVIGNRIPGTSYVAELVVK